MRVASHMRCAHKGGFTTVVEHLPERHQNQAQWTPERLVAWGEHIGVACAGAVQRMLERQRHPEHAYRACLGLLSLSKRYGEARLEAAFKNNSMPDRVKQPKKQAGIKLTRTTPTLGHVHRNTHQFHRRRRKTNVSSRRAYSTGARPCAGGWRIVGGSRGAPRGSRFGNQIHAVGGRYELPRSQLLTRFLADHPDFVGIGTVKAKHL
jgi:hypothetical protein